MKKILLLSDTHGYIDESILKFVKESDEVWHAGDIGDKIVHESISQIKPLLAVYGNIDDQACRKTFPETKIIETEGVKTLMLHIAGSFGKYNTETRSKIEANQPAILVCGHSHILKIAYDEKYRLLYINPGAAGKYGSHKIRTMVRFEIDKSLIKNMEVIELGSRTKI